MKKIFASLLIAFSLLFSWQAKTVLAQGAWTQGIQIAGQASGLSSAEPTVVLLTVLEWLLIIFVTLSFISFVVYGIMFLMAGVNKNMADQARRGVGYSVLALVVSFSALIVVYLVFDLLNTTE